MPLKIDPSRASWGGIVVAVFASRFPHLVDKIILASFGIRVNDKLVQAIKAGQQLNGNATGEQVAGVIIKYFGQHLSESFKKKMYDQFTNIKKSIWIIFVRMASCSKRPSISTRLSISIASKRKL
jgi:pimeloyl-ACP methyl ester carboxylesterase